MAEPEHEARARELMQPIVDVMTGADGGVAFSRLYHGFLPDILEKADAGDPLATEFILMVTRFSTLCKTMMEK